ncbi:uncharacterized protein TNCV_5080651 [Trichonephila clavipes]|nr:uncharacterized protein TNCV_5080651 [Trichonephila clavipes]
MVKGRRRHLSPTLLTSTPRHRKDLEHLLYTEGLQWHLATLGLLATDHVILNHDQVTWATPELAPSLLTIPHQREDVSALDRFNMHRCPTRRVFIGTELELMPAVIRCLDHWATIVLHCAESRLNEKKLILSVHKNGKFGK